MEAFTTSGSSNIEIELAAQAVLFSVPAADAKLEFFWGSEDEDSSLEATIPLMDIFMVEPEVEGSDVYLAVRLDSPWGLSTLAMAESITLKVNGVPVSGDPLKQRWAIPFVSHGRGRVLQAGMKPSTSRLSWSSSQGNRPCEAPPRTRSRPSIQVAVPAPIIPR